MTKATSSVRIHHVWLVRFIVSELARLFLLWETCAESKFSGWEL